MQSRFESRSLPAQEDLSQEREDNVWFEAEGIEEGVTSFRARGACVSNILES